VECRVRAPAWLDRWIETCIVVASPPEGIRLSIHVALNHVTHYRYDRRVSLGPQLIRLRPAPHSRTRILSYSQRITPAEHFINWQQDPESNYLARVVVPEQTTEFRIEVDLVAEMAVLNPFDFFLDAYAEHAPFDYQPAERRELAPYLVTQPLSELAPSIFSSTSTSGSPRISVI
jgi:transglutaminase-like putative cysteine protease